MAIDIWNLTIPSKKSKLVITNSIDDAKESNKSGGHFVEKSNPKTSKKAAFDIWSLTNSSSNKHQTSSSLDVFSPKQQKRLIESSGIPSDDRKEISLGTVASLQVHAASAPRLADRLAEKQAKTFCPTAAEHGQERKASGGNPTQGCIKGESAAAMPPDALQGVPLSDREREDIATGLTPAMARRAAEARVDTLEWLLGLETLTQEQVERVASFRKMDAALISARGKKPYLDTLGIPRFPSDCEPKYRHWADGQPLLDTLLELKAQDWAIDSRVTRERSPEDWQRWQEIKAMRRT